MLGLQSRAVRTFGKYRLLEPLATGGMAEVWRAEVTGAEGVVKEVALKLVRGDGEVELRGIQQCLNLKHPNLVALFDLRAGCDTVAEFAVRFREVLLRHLERADTRLEQLRRVKRELREALANIQQSLPQDLAEACPCAVATVADATERRR